MDWCIRLFILLVAITWSCLSATAWTGRSVARKFELQKNNEWVYELDTLAESSIIEIGASISRNRNTMGLGKTSWWMELQDRFSRSLLRASLRWGNDNLGDTFDRRYLRLTVDSVTTDGKYVQLLTCDLEHDVDLYNGMNALVSEFKDGSARFWVGKDYERYAGKVTFSTKPSKLVISANQELKVHYVALQQQPDRSLLLQTRWTISALEQYIAASTDPVEGFWTYLDRDTDSKWAVPGGFYRLAIVKNKVSGYDIIYVDGAKVQGKRWVCGMLKGELRPTIFINHYDLEWYDADRISMRPEISADIEQGGVLVLRFPLYHSTLRFFREPKRNEQQITNPSS